jgi:hypothetical protein
MRQPEFNAEEYLVGIVDNGITQLGLLSPGATPTPPDSS